MWLSYVFISPYMLSYNFLYHLCVLTTTWYLTLKIFSTIMNSKINGHEQCFQRLWTVKSTAMNSFYKINGINGNNNGHFYKIHFINISPSFIIFTSKNMFPILSKWLKSFFFASLYLSLFCSLSVSPILKN